jgi:membrane protease YdiL (CAAX protease family)
MKENKELVRKYPTPGACILVFVITLALGVTIGTVLQIYAFLPGLYVTEWLLVLGPPLFLLWMKKVNIKETLKLHQFKGMHVLLGIVGGLGIYFISIATVIVMEDILGPYPGEFIQEVFPTTWLSFIPWILAVAFSAGVCEEILYRGFIQNGLHNHWGPAKGLAVATVLFTIAHLDPWRTPAVILIGLLAGYLLIRTGSLYSAIAVHITANTTSNVLAFTQTFPEGTSQWLLVLGVSLVLVLVILVFMEMGKKKGS